jgi:hypothetical protein
MSRVSNILTLCSVVAAVAGLAIYALAASPTGCLPPGGAIAGWSVMDGSTRAGAMGEKVSFEVYDGAVDSMKAQGIRFFAQRMYKAAPKRFITVDAFQFRTNDQARAAYTQKRNSFGNARPRTDCQITNQAFVATINNTTVGCVRAGIFMAEVTFASGCSDADRATVKAFLSYISRKLSA